MIIFLDNIVSVQHNANKGVGEVGALADKYAEHIARFGNLYEFSCATSRYYPAFKGFRRVWGNSTSQLTIGYRIHGPRPKCNLRILPAGSYSAELLRLSASSCEHFYHKELKLGRSCISLKEG